MLKRGAGTSRARAGKTIPTFVADPEACRRVLETLSLVSGEIRLKVLCLLSEGDHCVTDLARIAGGKRSNVSQQLKLLTLAGYLERVRQDRRVVYHLRDERVRSLLRFLHQHFGSV